MYNMYGEIYKDLCTNGLACHLGPLWRNEKGEVVEEEEQACSLKSKYKLIHPHWFLSVEEVGSNTF
jgi:hypothetical protein